MYTCVQIVPCADRIPPPIQLLRTKLGMCTCTFAESTAEEKNNQVFDLRKRLC